MNVFYQIGAGQNVAGIFDDKITFSVVKKYELDDCKHALSLDIYAKTEDVLKVLKKLNFFETEFSFQCNSYETVYYVNEKRDTMITCDFKFTKDESEDHPISEDDTLVERKDCQIEEEVDEEDIARYQIYCISKNKELVKEINSLLLEISTTPKTKNKIYMVVNSQSSVTLKDMGYKPVPFEKDNYSKENIEWFDKICLNIENSSKEESCGRLTILAGPPGTGKSFFIGGLVGNIDAIFVFCSSYTFREIAGPNLSSLFIDIHNYHAKGKPIVFILEDADDLLVKRNDGNRAAVEVILSAADSFFGRSLNLQILATTNESIENLDKAVSREGRLFGKVNFDPLPPSQTFDVYKRLIESKGKELGDLISEDLGSLTLAQIYMKAKEHETGIKKKKRRKVGF